MLVHAFSCFWYVDALPSNGWHTKHPQVKGMKKHEQAWIVAVFSQVQRTKRPKTALNRFCNLTAKFTPNCNIVHDDYRQRTANDMHNCQCQPPNEATRLRVRIACTTQLTLHPLSNAV